MNNLITYNIKKSLIEISYTYDNDKYLTDESIYIPITYNDVERWLSKTYGINSEIINTQNNFIIKTYGLDDAQNNIKELIEHMVFNSKEDAINMYYSIITADLCWRHVKKREFSSIRSSY